MTLRLWVEWVYSWGFELGSKAKSNDFARHPWRVGKSHWGRLDLCCLQDAFGYERGCYSVPEGNCRPTAGNEISLLSERIYWLESN
jgi:hypothetical protein